MNGLDKMNLRLNYQGGNAESRMQQGKLRSLKKALLYSYQSTTIALRDRRKFRCLLNPNKNTDEYDDKILSIPYEDVCLNSYRKDKIEPTNIEVGDTFEWVDTNSYWLIYERYYEEDAYFRAKVRRCTNVVEFDDVQYRVCLINYSSNAFNTKTSIQVHTAWNNPNAYIYMIISKDDRTLKHLHRLKQIKVYEENMKIKKTWKIINVNESFGDGVIQVFLKEDYENSLSNKEENKIIKNKINKNEPIIIGPKKVTPFNRFIYKVKNIDSGTWYVKYGDQPQVLISEKATEIELYINKTKDKSFNIIFKSDNLTEDLTFTVDIGAF